MASPFPPRREADLLTWSATFKAKIIATPVPFSLTPAQATLYGTKHDAFASSYAVANDPTTRSPANVALKDAAREDLIAYLRLLAGIVQRAPNTTNPIRVELGLPERNPEPTPIPPPAYPPLLEVKSVSGRTARVRLIDTANPTRRGRPPGTSGAALFSHVGPTAPPDLADWKFEGNTGRTTVNVLFPSSVASGATVWLTAFWFNQRKQPGPASDAVSANLPGGSVGSVAA